MRGGFLVFLKNNLWQIFTFALILGISLSRTIAIAEPDSFWQIRSGQDFLEHPQFMTPDSYSWSAEGKEYLSNSWLWNVLLGVVYGMASFGGVTALVGIYVGSILSLTVYYLRLRNTDWVHIFVGVALVSVFLGKWFSARPQINDYLLLVVGLIIIHKLAQKHPAYLFMALGFVMVLWNNLHLTGPVGAICFGGAYFLIQYNHTLKVLSKGTLYAVLRSMSLVLFLLGLCLLTPYGVSGMTKSFETASASSGLISEWASPWDISEPSNIYSALTLLFILIPMVYAVKEKRWVEMVYLVGLFGVGSYQARWIPFVIIMALPYICGRLGGLSFSGMARFTPYAKVAAFSVILATVAMGTTTFFTEDKVSRGNYGYALLEYVPSDCKLYNDVSFGGPMILMRPEVKVSMDGRNDLYGRDEYLTQAHLTYAVEGTDDWLERNSITCVLIHNYQGLDGYLEQRGDWKLEAEDLNGARLWVKK